MTGTPTTSGPNRDTSLHGLLVILGIAGTIAGVAVAFAHAASDGKVFNELSGAMTSTTMAAESSDSEIPTSTENGAQKPATYTGQVRQIDRTEDAAVVNTATNQSRTNRTMTVENNSAVSNETTAEETGTSATRLYINDTMEIAEQFGSEKVPVKMNLSNVVYHWNFQTMKKI